MTTRHSTRERDEFPDFYADMDNAGTLFLVPGEKPEPTIEAYRKFARLGIDAVNLALVGIPEEKVRYHLCWGSWHGPHTHDLPLEHIT